MLENLHNGQFRKSAVLWHFWVPRVVVKNNLQLRCKYLCGYTLLFFTIEILFLSYLLTSGRQLKLSNYHSLPRQGYNINRKNTKRCIIKQRPTMNHHKYSAVH